VQEINNEYDVIVGDFNEILDLEPIPKIDRHIA